MTAEDAARLHDAQKQAKVVAILYGLVGSAAYGRVTGLNAFTVWVNHFSFELDLIHDGSVRRLEDIPAPEFDDRPNFMLPEDFYVI